MTIRALYRRAAYLRRAHAQANTRTAALDVITSRRVRIDANTLWWRKAGSRAGRVTMDRGYAAVMVRHEAREQMLVEIPWRVPEVDGWALLKMRRS